MGGAEGTAPIGLKQTEFSTKHFAWWMGQPIISIFNKWKDPLVAGCLKAKHQSIIWIQICLQQLHDGPLHWETAIADDLVTSENRLHVECVDIAERIWQHWEEIILNYCASPVRIVRNKRNWCKNQLVTYLGELAGVQTRGNLPELVNKPVMVVILCVRNSDNAYTSSIQLEAADTYVRNRKEKIEFVEINCGPKQLYCPTALCHCTLTQAELHEEYMRHYAPG